MTVYFLVGVLSGVVIGIGISFIYAVIYQRLNPPPKPLPDEVRLFATALTIKSVSVLEGMTPAQAMVMEHIVTEARKQVLNISLMPGDSVNFKANVKIT